MLRQRWTAIAFAWGIGVLAPGVARADVAPEDSCDTVGQSCANAPPDYATKGICKSTECNKTLPSPDGGLQTHTYTCTLCAAGGGTGSGGATATGGTTGNNGNKDDSGCAVSPLRRGGAVAAFMLGAGALALLVDRRSRRRPRR